MKSELDAPSRLRIRKVAGAPNRRRPARATGRFVQVKKRDAAATRARILQAAMEEFAAKGLDARIEDITEMAGANRRMAYYYFGSKEGLYLAALEAAYFELVRVEAQCPEDRRGNLRGRDRRAHRRLRETRMRDQHRHVHVIRVEAAMLGDL